MRDNNIQYVCSQTLQPKGRFSFACAFSLRHLEPVTSGSALDTVNKEFQGYIFPQISVYKSVGFWLIVLCEGLEREGKNKN